MLHREVKMKIIDVWYLEMIQGREFFIFMLFLFLPQNVL